ncbi:heparin lyase I family protein [Gordonia amicalis]|nr:heparin lyase I family protein [Gordonia amicalis]
MLVIIHLLNAVLGLNGTSAYPEWTNGFASRSVTWSGVQTSKGGSIELVDQGGAGIFRVDNPGAAWSGLTTQRAERVAASSEMRVRTGSVRTFNFEVSVPLHLDDSPNSWLIFAQIHQSLSKCPPNVDLRLTSSPFEALPVVDLTIRGGRLSSDVCAPQYERVFRVGNVIKGSRISVSLSAAFSAERGRAHTSVCLNDTMLVVAENVPNLYTGMDAYLKQGIYRPRSRVRSVLTSADVKFTKSVRCKCGGMRSC